MATLGEVIRARREELGLTQEELAQRIGDTVRQAEVSRLEHDRITLPRRDRMEQLAAALDLPLGMLLASSGWVGAEEALATDQPAPDVVAATAVPASGLTEVLAEAKEVVAHLQELVDVAEGTAPKDSGRAEDRGQAAIAAE